MLAKRSLARLSLLLLAMAIIGLAASRTPLARAQSGGASITTDQQQYQVGDPIEICYTVPGPGSVVITDISADGRRTVLLSGQDDGTGGCSSGTISPPAGTECVRLDYQGIPAQSSQACFQVVSSSGGGVTAAPAGGPCADPNNHCANSCGLVTYPGGPADPCNPGPSGGGPCADPSGQCTTPHNGPTPPQPGPRPQPCADPSGNCHNTTHDRTVSVYPSSGAPGDTILLVGQGFNDYYRGELLYINLFDATGMSGDPDYLGLTCQNFQSALAQLYQALFAAGCVDDVTGSQILSDSSGTVVEAFTVPDWAAPGPGKVCLVSAVSTTVCTAFTVLSGGD